MHSVRGNDLTFNLPSTLCSFSLSSRQFCNAGLKKLLSINTTNLSEIDISGLRITGEGFSNVLPQSLSSLQLSQCRITSKGLCDILSNDLPNLEYLDLSSSCITGIDCSESFALSLTALTTLDICNNEHMTEECVLRLFLNNKLPNLTELNMSGLKAIANFELQPSLPQSLVCLDIFAMTNLTNNGLKQLLSHNLLNLHALGASSLYSITGDGLVGVLPRNLNDIDLSHCKSLTCRGLYDLLVNNSSFLEKIDITGSLTDQNDSNVKFVLSITAPKATVINK
eukprot:gene4284-6071_t